MGYWYFLKRISPTPGINVALIFLSFAIPAIVLAHLADALGAYLAGR